MTATTIGRMSQLIVHYVGNKNEGDGVRLSSEETGFEEIEEYLYSSIGNNINLENLFQF